ncbi:MAG TPA: YraN family protein [Clostridiaceae bacterium]
MIKNKNDLGNIGEELAKKYLLNIDYSIISTKYRSKYGEIDIVARKAYTIIFVEVKLRSNLNYGYPCEAVTKTKRQKIYKTALFFIANNYNINANYRFDVIEVYSSENKYTINHLENAFY